MADEAKAGRAPFLIGTLLSGTWKALVANLVPFLVVVTLLLSPVIAITIFGGRNPFADPPEPFSVWELLAIPLTLVLTQVATAALIYGVFQHLRGNPASVSACLSVGFRKMPVTLLIAISYSVIVALGFILCLVPGIYLGVIYCLSVPVAVIEEKGAFAAMKRSKALTLGHGWTLLASFLILIFGLSLVNVTGLILLVRVPLASGIWTSVLQIIQALVQATLTGVAYYQIRATEEDLDLATIAKVFE